MTPTTPTPERMDLRIGSRSAAITDKNGQTLRTYAKFPIMSYYLELLPVDNMVFDNLYDIAVTVLNVPKMIHLEAAVTA